MIADVPRPVNVWNIDFFRIFDFIMLLAARTNGVDLRNSKGERGT